MYILAPGEVWQLDWQFMTQCNTSYRQYQLGALAKQRRWVHCSLLLELLVSKFNLNFTDFVYYKRTSFIIKLRNTRATFISAYFLDLLDCKYFIPCTKIYFSTFRNATFIAKLSDVSKLNFLDMSNVHLLIAIKVLTQSIIAIICSYLRSQQALEKQIQGWHIKVAPVQELFACISLFLWSQRHIRRVKFQLQLPENQRSLILDFLKFM